MRKYFFMLLSILIIISTISTVMAGDNWYKLYADGLKAMQRSDWRSATQSFRKAIRGNPKEQNKVRTYGMHFIKYYPHRELGISLYHLGNIEEAGRQLKMSMQQEPSQRARNYLNKIKSDALAARPKQKPVIKTPLPPVTKPQTKAKSDTEMIVGKQTIKLVGERMGIAIFPFDNKGASKDLGEIILDKMITVFVNQGRFKVMERAQLDKILAEQSLGSSGILDAKTAAEIGKGIGVDGIVIGSVAAASTGAISVDARVIDTESAAIIVAQDAYSGSSDAQSVKNAVENLARKITEKLPLLEGYIIRIDGEQVILDVGRNGGLKKGMKCVVYKEGAAIKHPITGEILGLETSILGEILVTESFAKYSVARKMVSAGGILSIGDKFITK